MERAGGRRCAGLAGGGWGVLCNYALCGVVKGAPSEYSVAHAAPHVVAATVLHDGSPTVRARAVLDSVYPVGEERVFHPIP